MELDRDPGIYLHRHMRSDVVLDVILVFLW